MIRPSPRLSSAPWGDERDVRLKGLLAAFVGFATTIPLIAHTVAFDLFTPARFGIMMASVFTAHILLCPRLFAPRELGLYGALLAYTAVSVLWAPSSYLAINTIIPSVNCVLILVLFGTLFTFYELRPTVSGVLAAFAAGAAYYTLTAGFPFIRPPGFSYNAFAVMYLGGLFVALLFGWVRRSRFLAGILALLFLLHIVATTSIKTNLGIALGVLVASLVYWARTASIVFRNGLLIGLFIAAIAYAIASSEDLSRRVVVGYERVSLGVEILQAREDRSGSTSYGLREEWGEIGMEGWLTNPVFGEGVEAFRATQGSHSHSVPIELLYNTGLIGFLLFYGIFASIAVRLVSSAGGGAALNLRALILAGLVCFAAMTAAGTPQYEYYLAMFVGVSVALIKRTDVARTGVEALSPANHRRRRPMPATSLR